MSVTNSYLDRWAEQDLSAVSLNLLVAALCIQWQVLVTGFLHLHYDKCEEEPATGIQKREAGGAREKVENSSK